MRAVKRWLKRTYAELRIAPRRAEIETRLGEHLGRRVVFRPAGAKGQDSVYFVTDRQATLGVLRLANPYKKRKPQDESSPFIWLDDHARLDREWDAYKVGGKANLTPTALWRAPDAIFCSYVPEQRMFHRLLANGGEFWLLLCAAARALGQLHEIGLVHMDACLANILADDRLERFTFIDFEYSPAPGLGEAQQKAYDHLRLVESSLKFMPARERNGYRRWIATLDECLTDDVRAADLAPLAPALSRLNASHEIVMALKDVFQPRRSPK